MEKNQLRGKNSIRYFFGKVFALLGQVGLSSFDIYFEDVHSTEEEKRKKYLMDKARKENITRDEAEELKRLLQKQKEEKEKKGDIVDAILLGLALLFVIWLLAKMSEERK